MSVVAVIPARGGSKGIPRKNLVQLNGRPLIAHTIEAALGSLCVDRVLVSTDDSEIAELAKVLGAESPFLRPAALADDTAPMLGVLQHTLDWLQEQGESVEALVLLQPTSPLRTNHHISECVSLFRSTSASSVVSIVEVPHQFNPVSVMRLSAKGFLESFLDNHVVTTRRQDKPMVYARNGPAVLVCHPDTLRAGVLYGAHCLPYLMSEADSLDIDTPRDLVLAELAFQTRGQKGYSC
jgi:CMP-N,N'-diacetyllegionaminic acid synthase